MRLDVFLTNESLAKSRSYARELIKNGLVEVDGKTAFKCSHEVSKKNSVVVKDELYSFVGRGGVKLECAIDSFKIDVSGLVCVDVGASTGGFTDCLLSRGAKLVYAVDSGHGQLDAKLLDCPKVVNMEGFNAKNLSVDSLGSVCDMAVCDLSFISQTLVTHQISSVLIDGACFITLIKPQFECGKKFLGKGGIVKNPKAREDACRKVIQLATECDLYCRGIIPSPIEGGAGNKEYLAFFVKNGESTVTDRMIREAIYAD